MECTMLRKLLFFIGVLGMATSLNAAPAFAAADQSLTVLPNGLNVLVQRDTRFPLVSLRLYVHAGSAYETREQAGISHLLEHMVFKGSDSRAAGDIAADVESVGGSLNAATSFDYTVYKVDVPAEHLALGVDVIKDMAFGATLDPEELEREKKVVISELERGEDAAASRVFKAMQPMLWGGTPYQWPIIGNRETVTNITRQDIKDYIDTYYQPQSMLAVVCGDVDMDEATALVQKHFGSLTNTRTLKPKRPLPLPEADGPHFAVSKGPWNKTYLAVAFPIPSLHSDDIAGLDLLAHMLGGDNTSLLYRHLKYDKGLVDQISAYSMTLDQVGMLYISATLDGDKLPAFWKELQSTLAGLSGDSFTDKDFDRAVLNIQDSLYSSRETIGGLTSKLGYFQFFEGSTKAEDRYASRLDAVNAKELQRLIDTYIQPGAARVAVELDKSSDEPEAVTAAMKSTMQDLWPAQETQSVERTAQDDAKTEVIDLPGGHSLVLQPDDTLPYTAMTMAFRGGNALIFPGEEGVSSLTAKALTKGTTRLSAPEFRKALSGRAASISASAGSDFFVLSTRYPTRYEDEMLPLFREALQSPAFAEKEIDRARKEQIAQVKQLQDQPLGLALQHMFPFLYANTPYRLSQLGTVEDVAEITRDDVLSYWERQRKQRWTLAVCGTYDRDAIIDMAESFAKAQPGEPFGYNTPDWNTDRELKLNLAERNQAHLLAIFPVPGELGEHRAELDLLRDILAGQSGLLFSDLRDKQGLGYSVTALLWQAPKTGFLAFYIGTNKNKLEKALQGFHNTVAQLKEAPLPEATISRAQNLMRGSYYRQNQSLSARAREAAHNVMLDEPLHYEQDIIEKAQHLTGKDIQNVAKTYLNWDKAYILTVEP